MESRVKFLFAILIVLILVLQVRLWYGEGSYLQVRSLEKEVAKQEAHAEGLRERNQTLEAEVLDLKKRLSAIEERARTDLGMVRQGETFYQYSISDE
jgi:cell division protein FtsB